MGRRWIVVGLSSVVAVMVGLGSLSPVWSESPKELRVSAIPDENPTELMRIYAPFAEYLSREIGIPVRYYNVVDYAATVEGWQPRNWIWSGTGALPSCRLGSEPAMRSL